MTKAGEGEGEREGEREKGREGGGERGSQALGECTKTDTNRMTRLYLCMF